MVESVFFADESNDIVAITVSAKYSHLVVKVHEEITLSLEIFCDITSILLRHLLPEDDET